MLQGVCCRRACGTRSGQFRRKVCCSRHGLFDTFPRKRCLLAAEVYQFVVLTRVCVYIYSNFTLRTVQSIVQNSVELYFE